MKERYGLSPMFQFALKSKALRFSVKGDPAQMSIYETESAIAAHSWEGTYAIVVIYIRSDLVLLVLLGWILRLDLAIRRDKPVAGKLSFTVNVSDLELQGPHFRQLEPTVRANGVD